MKAENVSALDIHEIWFIMVFFFFDLSPSFIEKYFFLH